MKLAGVVLLFALFAIAAVSSCPHTEPCDCIPLPECSSVHAKMQELHKFNKKRLHYKFTRHVKKLHCSFEGKTPIICCPPEVPDNEEDLIKGEWIKPYQQRFKQRRCMDSPSKATEAPLSNNEPITTTTSTTSIISTTSATSSSREQKEKELLAVCGKDLNRGEFFGNQTALDDFPWLALLKYETLNETKLLCGGVLISDQYVLTAAHCVTSQSNKLVSVRLGEYDTTTDKDCLDDGAGSEYCNEPAKDLEIESTIVHDNYSDIGHRDEIHSNDDQSDIALIKLKTKVKFDDSLIPICLPYSAEKEKQLYTVAGWSKSMVPNNEGLTQKLVSKISTLTPEECENHRVTTDYTSSDHICAGKEGKERACIADAGGPIMAYEKKKDKSIRMTVFGVGFMDLTCDRIGLPGVFTKVHKYMPWITEHIYE